MVDGKIVFTNITEYVSLTHINLLPARLPASAQKKLLSLNRHVLDVLGITQGMTHAEFFLTPSGEWFFGEINTRPPGGYIMPLLLMAYAQDPWLLWIASEYNHVFSIPRWDWKACGVCRDSSRGGACENFT